MDDFTIHSSESAVVGSTARLPCDVKISSPEDSITLILWYRGDRKSPPIYSVDARAAANLASAKHHPVESLRGRIKFELTPSLLQHSSSTESMSSKVSSSSSSSSSSTSSSSSSSKSAHHSTASTSRAYLILDPILIDDEAVYLCRVDFKWSRTMNTVTNLTVVCEYFTFFFFLLLVCRFYLLIYTLMASLDGRTLSFPLDMPLRRVS